MNDLKNLYEPAKKYYGFNDKCFVSGDSDPITNGKIRYMKNRNCKLADVKQIKIHNFRHSCASLLINSNASINVMESFGSLRDLFNFNFLYYLLSFFL